MSTETPNFNLYRRYLALDGTLKRLAECGVSIERFSVNGPETTYGEPYWQNSLESDLEAGKVPNVYRFADVQVYIPSFEDYGLPTEEREQKAQERREQLIRDYVAKYPDTIVARFDGSTYLYHRGEYDDFGVTINVGQALCERVLVGEDVSEVPDPELAEQALADVPLVKKVTPRYEWRCNDAELLATP